MRIVFLGSADFGLPAFTRLIESNHDIVGVVTTPPRHKGRGLKLAKSPVGLFAEAQGIEPIFWPENLKDPDFITKLKALNADLFVVIAYRILPEEVFNMPPNGTVNAHASLLPRFRGPAPIHRAIESGDKETGVTIFRLDNGIDTGNILSQESTVIGEDETTPELYRRLSSMAADQIMESIALLEKGDAKYKAQDHNAATKAPKLKKSEGHIDWNLEASQIASKVRAFKPFPGTFSQFNGKKLGIEKVEVSSDLSSDNIGEIIKIEKDSFSVSCNKSTLRILEVKPEGKKTMPSGAFLNGTTVNIGDRLC